MYNRTAKSCRESCGRFGNRSPFIPTCVDYNCVRGAHKIPLARQLASRDSRVSHFFLTIYEIVIKPCGFRDSDDGVVNLGCPCSSQKKTSLLYSFSAAIMSRRVRSFVAHYLYKRIIISRIRSAEIGEVSIPGTRYNLRNKNLEKHARPCCIGGDRGSSPRIL